MKRFASKKLLYIEDDAESRALMADILRLHGYEFIGAARGIEGIRLATEENPDLILMDINLPDMNGDEVTTLLKSIKSLENTPIIALSAYNEADARERTLTAGCDGYISKPINIAEFVQLIDEYLKGRKETVTPEVEKKYLTEYNIRLGEKLQNKIEELEHVNLNLTRINEELKLSKDQLTDYNNRLFAMNTVANSLRVQESPVDILEILPERLIEEFDLDRCIIFEYSEEKESLTALHAAGTTRENLSKLKFRLERSFYRKLKNEYKVLWIKSKQEILNNSLYKIAQNINSTSFLIGSLSGFGTRKDVTGIFESIISKSPDEEEEDITLENRRKLVIFLDRGRDQKVFATYEVRVLKAFLQTASIIYENMQLYHKLVKLFRIKEQEAITDALTEVYNYRYFQSQIEREIVRSERHAKNFSIAMIDIDNFKQYNDNHGHLNGDIALKLVAKTLIENVRKSDILARYGGDEFVMILPELNKDQAKSLAEKLCAVIMKTKLPFKKSAPKIRLTISLGIASYPADGKSEENLLKKADEGSYLAKDLGRNTVCISA